MFHLAKMTFPEVERAGSLGRCLGGSAGRRGRRAWRAPAAGFGFLCGGSLRRIGGTALEATGYDVVIAPTINYGVARAAIDFPGTLSLGPETLRSMVVEIGRSLARHGLKRLVILNGHRDIHHMTALDEARSMLEREKVAQVFVVGFASDPEMTAACYREGVRRFYNSPRPDREGHGGESETSVALYSFPELVKRDISKTLTTQLRLRRRRFQK